MKAGTHKSEFDIRGEVILKKEDKSMLAGDILFNYSFTENGDLKPLWIPSPNYTALYLSIADKNFKIASDSFNDKIIKSISDRGDFLLLDCEKADTVLYDFMEATFISIVFAYTAVECLVNSLIPNYIILIGKNKKDTYEFKSKKFLERYISLDEKIKKSYLRCIIMDLMPVN